MNGAKVFETIGICGGGKMGSSFLQFIASFDYKTIFYIRNEQKLQQIQRRYGGKSEGKAVFTGKIEDLSHCDVVFEFVSEDVAIKSWLVEQLHGQTVDSGPIFVTGSSTIVPSKICKEEALPSCIGVHFIYPVQYVKTVEVIHNRNTSPEVIQKIQDFLIYTGKNPVVVNEETGSFSIKILLSVQNEAFKLSEEFGVSPVQIDRIVAMDNLVLPPFELCDSVGFDVIYNSIMGLYEGSNEYDKYCNFRNHLQGLMANGCLGRKNGRGFCCGLEDNLHKSFIELDETQENHIRTRIKLAYLNSCLDHLDKGFLDTDQLDTAMGEINQSPSGPIRLLFEQGPGVTLDILEEFAMKYGERYKPPGVLKYMVNNKVGREKIDQQIRLFKMGGVRPDWHHPHIISQESPAQA